MIHYLDYNSTWRPIELDTAQMHSENQSLSGKVYNRNRQERRIDFQEHVSGKIRNDSALGL